VVPNTEEDGTPVNANPNGLWSVAWELDEEREIWETTAGTLLPFLRVKNGMNEEEY
jgi:hypothetical protein